MMKCRLARIALAVCILAFSGLAITVVTSVRAYSQPLKLRISWVAIPNNLPPMLMEKPELMTRAGQSYIVDPVRFPGTPQSVAALASGDLDIALLTFSSFPLAIQNAKLTDLRVISDEFIDGMPGYYTSEFLVLKDGPIKTIDNLKGKVVAVNVKGGGTDMALRAITRKHGLEVNRDFTQVEVGFGNMKAALFDKKADLIGLGVPALSADPEIKAMTRSLFTQRDALGPAAQVIWVAREEFLKKNRAALVDFMADALRVRRFFTDPKNHAEVVDIAARLTNQPRERLDPWLFGKGDFYRTSDGVLDIAILQDNIDKMVSLGFLKSGIDARKFQDFSIVKEAASRLN
jgi:NitT/TauT family transport system substrate-binding protein